jgi:hypothetical protein
VFGEEDLRKNNFRMHSPLPIDVYLHLNSVKQEDEEVIVETDQNLQRFFSVESGAADANDINDGDVLKIKLDVADVDDAGYFTSVEKGYILAEKDKLNYVNATRNVRIDITIRKTSVFVSKHNFGLVNVYVEPATSHSSLFKTVSSDLSTILLNCNGSVLVDSIMLNDIKTLQNRNMNDKRKIKEGKIFDTYLSFYICSEAYTLFVSQAHGVNEFIASKDRKWLDQIVEEVFFFKSI